MKTQRTFPGQFVANLFVVFCIAAAGCSEAIVKPAEPGHLSNLTISPAGGLEPPFSSDTTSYAASVPPDAASVAVMATTDDDAATITVDGTTIPPGALQSVPLRSDGPTPIEVVIMSADGQSTTYVVTVTKHSQCTPASPEDCCPQDYQERVCGNGGCGKESRTCGASGKWDAWSGCGVDGAKIGKVCRKAAQSCDPVETCGGAVDCPADYLEVPLQGRPGCWQDIRQGFNVQGGHCAPGHGCVPSFEVNAAQTADRLCVLRGFKVHVDGISDWMQASEDILLGYWNGSGFATIGRSHGKAMSGITCLK